MFNPSDQQLSSEEYSKAADARHVLCGMILFGFARHTETTITQDHIARNFTARADMMARGIFKLWEIEDYADSWILHRALLDRLRVAGAIKSSPLSETRRHTGFAVCGANYIWSKNIDAVSYTIDLDGINVINRYNVNADRSVSDYNVPHRFVFNYVWMLPSPQAGLAKAILGGWENSGIWTWQAASRQATTRPSACPRTE